MQTEKLKNHRDTKISGGIDFPPEMYIEELICESYKCKLTSAFTV